MRLLVFRVLPALTRKRGLARDRHPGVHPLGRPDMDPVLVPGFLHIRSPDQLHAVPAQESVSVGDIPLLCYEALEEGGDEAVGHVLPLDGEAVAAERSLLKRLDGGCQLPFGVNIRSDEGEWKLELD